MQKSHKTPINKDEKLGELALLLQEKDALLEEKNKQLQAKNALINILEEKVNLLTCEKFARKSERHIDPDIQGRLFDEATPEIAEEDTAQETTQENNNAAPENQDDVIDVPAHRRRKKGRPALPEHLPRQQMVHDLADDEKVCPCGCALVQVSEERTEELCHIPAKKYVMEHVYPKYACKACEDTMRQAKAPKRAIPKSIASPELLAQVVVSKYVDHLPLYRQAKIYEREGIQLPRATLSNWVLKMGDLLRPIYDKLREVIIEYDVAFSDETTLQVLCEPERAASTTSYMWAFGGGPPDKQVQLFHYSASRAHEVPKTFLQGFKGYVHVDGFKAYETWANSADDITLVGCWYHARRKFKEAEKASKKATLAKYALHVIKQLSDIERKAQNKRLAPEAIKLLRDKHARPLLTTFKAWLEQHALTVLPKSLLGNAIQYTLNQWPKLLTYLDDGRLENSNNRSERAIKPFVIGRKNWLFNNSVSGARAAEVIYSVIETAKLHNVNVYDYLTFLFQHIPQLEDHQSLDGLLPFNWQNR